MKQLRFAVVAAIAIAMLLFTGLAHSAVITGGVTSLTLTIDPNSNPTQKRIRLVPGERKELRFYFTYAGAAVNPSSVYGSGYVVYKNAKGDTLSTQSLTLGSAYLSCVTLASTIDSNVTQGAVSCTSGTYTIIPGYFTIEVPKVGTPNNVTYTKTSAIVAVTGTFSGAVTIAGPLTLSGGVVGLDNYFLKLNDWWTTYGLLALDTDVSTLRDDTETSLALKQNTATAATDTELSTLRTDADTSLALKQNAATAATDTELTTLRNDTNTSLSAKQDSATAATDSELSTQIQSVHNAYATSDPVTHADWRAASSAPMTIAQWNSTTLPLVVRHSTLGTSWPLYNNRSIASGTIDNLTFTTATGTVLDVVTYRNLPMLSAGDGTTTAARLTALLFGTSGSLLQVLAASNSTSHGLIRYGLTSTAETSVTVAAGKTWVDSRIAGVHTAYDTSAPLESGGTIAAATITNTSGTNATFSRTNVTSAIAAGNYAPGTAHAIMQLGSNAYDFLVRNATGVPLFTVDGFSGGVITSGGITTRKLNFTTTTEAQDTAGKFSRIETTSSGLALMMDSANQYGSGSRVFSIYSGIHPKYAIWQISHGNTNDATFYGYSNTGTLLGYVAYSGNSSHASYGYGGTVFTRYNSDGRIVTYPAATATSITAQGVYQVGNVWRRSISVGRNYTLGGYNEHTVVTTGSSRLTLTFPTAASRRNPTGLTTATVAQMKIINNASVACVLAAASGEGLTTGTNGLTNVSSVSIEPGAVVVYEVAPTGKKWYRIEYTYSAGDINRPANTKITQPDGATTAPFVITMNGGSGYYSGGAVIASRPQYIQFNGDGDAWFSFPVPARQFGAKVVIDRIYLRCEATGDLAISDITLYKESGGWLDLLAAPTSTSQQLISSDIALADNMSYSMYVVLLETGGGTLTIRGFSFEYHLE